MSPTVCCASAFAEPPRTDRLIKIDTRSVLIIKPTNVLATTPSVAKDVVSDVDLRSPAPILQAVLQMGLKESAPALPDHPAWRE